MDDTPIAVELRGLRMLRGKQVGGIEDFLDVGGEQGRQDRVYHACGHIF